MYLCICSQFFFMGLVCKLRRNLRYLNISYCCFIVQHQIDRFITIFLNFNHDEKTTRTELVFRLELVPIYSVYKRKIVLQFFSTIFFSGVIKLKIISLE